MKWRYLGCGSRPGHYLFDPHKGTFSVQRNSVDHILETLDGKLAPFPEPEQCNYVASFSRLEGLGYSALSWWDRTIDKRRASNSIIFAPSLAITAPEVLIEGPKWFPWVFKRLPQPLVLMTNNSNGTSLD